MKRLITFTLGMLFSLLCHAKASDTVKVFFRFGDAALDDKAQSYLDSLAYVNYYHSGQKLLILGYADYAGTTDFNKGLSYKRANGVKQYLQQYLSLQAEVVMCAGKGAINGRPIAGVKGNPKDRFVKIVRIQPLPTAAIVKNTPSTDTQQTKRVPKYKHKHEEWVGAGRGRQSDNEPPGFDDWAAAHNKLHENDNDIEEHEEKEGRPWAGTVILNNAPLEKQRILRGLPKCFGHGYCTGLQSLAMLYALDGQKDSVFYYLNKSLDSCVTCEGWEDIWDPNILGFFQFERYVGTPEWKAFEARIIGRFNSNQHIKNPALALQLIMAFGADQSVRFPATIEHEEETRHAWTRIDAANALLIKDIISKHGFPGISAVGKEAYEAAFILIQHCDKDTTFQKQILQQMKKLLAKKEVDKEDVAMLTDRVMSHTTGNQLYGTQFRYLPAPFGQRPKTELLPIVDPEHVNERRKEMGLPPLEEVQQ